MESTLYSTETLDALFPSIADSYDCVTVPAPSEELLAYAKTVMAEVATIVAKRKAA